MGQPRTAFVLAGGGSLGAVEVGMLQTLVERGIAPDLVVGASVGAINGAFFAGRPDRAGVESLAAIWRGLRRGDVFPLGLMGGFLGFIGKRPHLLAPDRLRALLGRHLPVARLEEAKVPCHVVATDVLSGEEVCLSSGVAVESPLCPLNVSSSAFPHSGQLIDRAAKSTRRWLDEGGLYMREVPGALRPHAHHKRGALGSMRPSP